MSSDSPTEPTQTPSASDVTPLAWRLFIGIAVVALTLGAWFGQGVLHTRIRSGMGFVAFFGVIAFFSMNLRAVNWRTIGWGLVLQIGLGLFVLKFEIFGVRPGHRFFEEIARLVEKFLEFTNRGSTFVFGKLADPATMEPVLGKNNGVIFACRVLPTIIFVSSFFTVLYYFGILQFIVRVLARVMAYFMHTSGAETLSSSANVFMGQTEAPLIVKPYLERMTSSELLTLMAGGMATVSGGVMAIYIGLKADPVALLTTSVMAAPCSLYFSKLLLPETEEPETRGIVKTSSESDHVNVIDAASSGAGDGLRLALNVAAMLIAFLAFIAMFDYLLGALTHWINYWFDQNFPALTLDQVFGWLFSPLAALLGVERADMTMTADLLGRKLVANELVAYSKFLDYHDALTPRGQILCTFALTGFANLSSIGIQIGGIGALAPSRRSDLARLGVRALLVGFLTTLTNACLAGMLL